MCRDIVKQVMEKESVCLRFDRPLAWQENFFSLGGESHPAALSVSLARINGFCEAFHLLWIAGWKSDSFPEEWAGLLGDQLVQATGIPGAIFVTRTISFCMG